MVSQDPDSRVSLHGGDPIPEDGAEWKVLDVLGQEGIGTSTRTVLGVSEALPHHAPRMVWDPGGVLAALLPGLAGLWWEIAFLLYW